MKIYYIKAGDIGKILILLIIALGVLLLSTSKDKVITTINDYRAIYQGVDTDKSVALTFNVDWGEEYIPEILKILEEEKATATFFISGRWAKRFPEQLKAIAAAGHEIGNHGYFHKHHERIGLEASLKEIQDTEKVIYDITKIKTKLFAPPYGEKGEQVIKSAYSIGYRTVYWTIDTIDWQRPAPEVLVERVKRKGLTNGAIILMHPTDPTTKALPHIIKYIKENSYQIKHVSQIAGGY